MRPPAPGSKLRYCGGCNSKVYCSKLCAQADWTEHKLVCESLRKTKVSALDAFEERGGQKKDFNEANRVLKAWFASVPGTLPSLNSLLPTLNPDLRFLNPEP